MGEMVTTGEFDARNAERSRAVCAAMAERSDTGKRVLTEREGRILDMWPRFEDGEPVMIGDAVGLPFGAMTAEAIEFSREGVHVKDDEDGDWNTSIPATRPLKRPAPKAIDADGVEIKVGDTVWRKGEPTEYKVATVISGTVYLTYKALAGVPDDD